ncbi:hypothetical protein EJ04DRAFT_511541 [Polyplosphaeria fusca]|uniref:Uncharacterized protein n=1 Tax=Polyplosphaeria fusca TaxID=682080 RepID=A0A9P4QZJ0_9PLEO|nr:hypothetical protein EJ04DRAFT_511541 [Polyplosphaeria fusca]
MSAPPAASTARSTGVASSTASNSPPQTSAPGQASDSGLSKGAKIGIGVGVPVFVILLIVGALFVYRLGRRREAGRRAQNMVDENGDEKTAINELDGAAVKRGELEGQSRRLELATQERPVEMYARPD